MGIRNVFYAFVITAIFFLSACQKVDPQVLLLGSGDGGSGGNPPVPVTPGLGRITNGSGVLESSGYRLKGRVVAVPSVPDQSGSGGYRIRGTVSF